MEKINSFFLVVPGFLKTVSSAPLCSGQYQVKGKNTTARKRFPCMASIAEDYSLEKVEKESAESVITSSLPTSALLEEIREMLFGKTSQKKKKRLHNQFKKQG